MAIEVRQLLIRSHVTTGAPASATPVRSCAGDPGEQSEEDARQAILAECKAWMVEQLRSLRER